MLQIRGIGTQQKTWMMCADQNAHRPSWQKRFINPNIGSQLLRFASQRSVSNLQPAHRIWDVLLEQGSRASRVAMRSYLIAMQRRDPDNPRMAAVRPLPQNNTPLLPSHALYLLQRSPTWLPCSGETPTTRAWLRCPPPLPNTPTLCTSPSTPS